MIDKPTYEELEQQIKELQRQGKEEVRYIQREWEKLFQAFGHPTFILDPQHRILQANRAALKAAGSSENGLLKKKCYQVFHDSQGPPEGCPLTIMLRSGSLEAVEREIEVMDNTFLVSLTPVLDEEGRLQKIIHTAINITERKQAEEALRESEEKFSKAFRASPNWISISRLEDGCYIEVNDSFLRITGYDREEVIGCTSVDLGIWVNPAERLDMVRTLKEQGSVSDLEVRFRTKKGEILTVERSAEQITLGGETCLISVNHDITRHRQLEDQLRQSQKMEAIGRLAGGIAHDFNNILTAILGYSDLLLFKLKPQDPMYNEIEEIRKAGQRAAALTHQLLAFSRRQILQQVALNLNTLISNLKNMLLRIIGEDIELVTILAPDLGQIMTDRGQMELMIMNLAVNARDALNRGGKLIIETANIHLEEIFVRQHPGSFAGLSVMLTISDTGIGMDAHVLSRIFEPFFTTKETGKGTGLGLSTVYGIVKQSGGYILVESAPGQGTTFKIFFPRIDQAEREAEKRAPSFPSQRGSGVILVVEDDSLIRNLMRQILTMNGYTVLEAQSGEEAMKLSHEYEGRIHLLTTDVVMPGMPGPELARQLQVLRPEIKVLFMSGYSDNVFPQYGILYTGNNFIQKPFTPAGLAQKIRELLI